VTAPPVPPLPTLERARAALAQRGGVRDALAGVMHDLIDVAPGPDAAPALDVIYQALLHDLAPAGPGSRRRERQVKGVYYTPPRIVEHLLDLALEPVIAARLAHAPPDPASRAAALLSIRVLDPACGSGRFLVAAADRLARHLARERTAPRAPGDTDLARARRDAAACVMGVDIDPVAVRLATLALGLPAGAPSLRVGNALAGVTPATHASATSRDDADRWCAALMPKGQPLPALFHWPIEFPRVFDGPGAGFDVVIGNPPFLNQLERGTASSRALAAIVRATTSGAVRRYADLAAAFLLVSTSLVRAGGRVALVQPQSLLASGDAAAVREALARNAALDALWIAGGRVFPGASVYVCAPVLIVGGQQGALRRSTGAECSALGSISITEGELASRPTWAHLFPELSGAPPVSRSPRARTLADIAVATADFRDQYYGLLGHIVEDSDLSPAQRAGSASFPALITSGLIDLAHLRWGATPTRVHKRAWRAPRLNRAAVMHDPDLAAWMRARLVPKILLATQTRVLELVVDDAGTLLPSVPVVTVRLREPRPDGEPDGGADPLSLWRLAAAIASPVASAVALRDYAGAALDARAIKLSARQLLTLPAPASGPRACAPWDDAARAFRDASHATSDDDRRGHLARVGALMLEAHEVPRDEQAGLLDWWLPRACPPARPPNQARIARVP
jgi:SAM-dependent methyltransferase